MSSRQAATAPARETSIGSENGNSSTDVPSRQSASTNNLSGGASASPRRGVVLSLKNLFGSSSSKEKESTRRLAAVVTNDGSIRQTTWDGLSKSSTVDKRVDTLKQLHEPHLKLLPRTLELPIPEQDQPPTSFLNRLLSDFFKFGTVVVRNRSLQVSTLEGLYHDTKDMLSDPDTKDPVLRLIIELTETQHKQLGLALRHTFFEQIRAMGCEELTLKWLNALSDYGRNVNGFEKDMDYLVADWCKETLSDPDHPQATLVLQLTQVLIKHNSAFIAQDSMTAIVRSVCIRACRTMEPPEPLTKDCLDVLDCVLKYSDLPRDQLMSVVSVFCIQVCSPTFRQQAWALAKSLLTSQLGHRTRQHLQSLLEQSISLSTDSDVPEAKCIRILRGAVFCLANANWGTSQIDAVRCSPANIVTSMEIAMAAHDTVCSDVLLALRRLVQKYGRELQQMTWLKLIRLFQTAIKLCEQNATYSTNCEDSLQHLLQLTEQLYKDGSFSASPDHLFDLIERCADRRPDSSVIALIEYRTGNISPLEPDWIDNILAMVKRYSHEKQVVERRTKALDALHSVFTKYRMLYEHDLITLLMLPVLSRTAKENDPRIQYQMINILFDVAKTVTLRGDCLLFHSVINLIRKLLNGSFEKVSLNADIDQVVLEEEAAVLSDTHSNSDPEISDANPLTMDNLYIMATGVDDIVMERWKQLTARTITPLLDVLVEHIYTQYDIGWTGDQGSEVRAAVMNALLAIHCCPITSRLQRSGKDDVEPQTNMFIRRRHDGHDGGFSWSDICRVVTAVINTDTSWLVLRDTLVRLGPVLEHIELVRTASESEVESLTHALIGLYQRSENGDFTTPEQQLAKFLPPVLATLLNYTSAQDSKNNEICRVLVDCVRHKQMETLMACDVAVQLVPLSMASRALVLMEHLIHLPSTAKRAIPIIEFMSDSAEIPEFHKFFQERHFYMVVDILTPYADVRQFNTYIVACIHRILMRWYAQIPDADITMRQNVRAYLEKQIRNAPYVALSEGMHRQHSGDGRQVPGNLFLLGGDPSTPPPMDGMATFREERGPDIIFEEVQRAMSAFFRLGRIVDDQPVPQRPANLVETSQEHYFINDTIISISIMMDKKEEEVENDVFSSSGPEVVHSHSSPPSDSFNDFRRRHQSAVQDRQSVTRELLSMNGKPKALDDLYATGGPHQQERRNTIGVKMVPAVSYTQLVVRHMYGKSCWLMRSLDEWPEDFERTAALPAATTSLLFHLINTSDSGVIRLKGRGKGSGDDTLQLAIRNLDRILGTELHAVGVLYVGPHQDTEPAILANTYGSERYAKFIKLLGDPINLDRYPAGLQPEMHGSYTFEYKDALSRIVFLVATLMPNAPNDPNCNSKKKLIANNFVSIVFNESGQPFKLGSVCGRFAHVALEVVPCGINSVLVTVHAKQEISCWMAMKRVLLCDASAARLLRKLIVRSQLSVNVWRSVQEDPNRPYISSGVGRLRKIHEIRDKMDSKQVLGGGGGGGQQRFEDLVAC